jgi:hypothetical protein
MDPSSVGMDWAKSIGSQLIQSMEIRVGGITVHYSHCCNQCKKIVDYDHSKDDEKIYRQLFYGTADNIDLCPSCDVSSRKPINAVAITKPKSEPS